MENSQDTKKLEAAVSKLEKVVQQLLQRVRALELETQRLKGASNRHHSQLYTHDRKISSITNRE